MPREDDSRLVALYDAHAPSVWRYVVHLTGDPAGADDIVQETLLRAWRSPRILAQEPASTRSWMFTVARNLVIDEARSARRLAIPEGTVKSRLHYGLRALRLALQEKGVTR